MPCLWLHDQVLIRHLVSNPRRLISDSRRAVRCHARVQGSGVRLPGFADQVHLVQGLKSRMQGTGLVHPMFEPCTLAQQITLQCGHNQHSPAVTVLMGFGGVGLKTEDPGPPGITHILPNSAGSCSLLCSAMSPPDLRQPAMHQALAQTCPNPVRTLLSAIAAGAAAAAFSPTNIHSFPLRVFGLEFQCQSMQGTALITDEVQVWHSAGGEADRRPCRHCVRSGR